MLTCPKCNFIQPPDQFCAKCGVDVAKFQKQQARRPSSFLKSTYTQFAIVFTAVIFLIFYVSSQNNEDGTTTSIASEAFFITDSNDSSLDKDTLSNNSLKSAAKKTNTVISQAPTNKVPTRSASFNKKTVSLNKIEQPSGKHQAEFKVIYAEVFSEYFNKITPEENSLDSNTFLLSSIRDSIQKGKKAQALKVLTQSRTKRLWLNKKTLFNNTPLWLSVVLVNTTEEQTEIHLQFSQDPKSSVDFLDYQQNLSLSIPRGESITISNILQARYIDDIPEQNVEGLLKIFNSEPFLLRDSLFVVFLEISYSL